MELSLFSNSILMGILIAIALGALLKGMTGLGLPMFAVPALASFTSVEEAVVLMIIPGIAANLWLVINHRRHRHLLREHLPFLISGFVGGLIGSAALVLIDDRWLKLFLVVWLGLYLIQYFVANGSTKIFAARGNAGYVLGLTGGTLQGSTGISAQVVAPYYHARGLAREGYAFAVAFTFLLFSVAQVAATTSLDLMSAARFQLSLIALVPTLMFTWLGIKLARKVSHALFNRILLVTFVLMELKLIADII